jgi:uncharacterized protein YdeI (YjbR/CyaY-like superfamily)
MASTPIYFKDAASLRRWFEKNAASATELVVGYMKRATGVPSVTWPESVDEALCFGWIDGVRNRVDDDRYRIRFSPRRRGSHWSLVNIRRVRALKAAGRVKPAGLAAFRARKASNTGRAPYEQRAVAKPTAAEIKAIRRHAAAWKYYSACPPSYHKMCHWWLQSAKKPETRARRLKKLIEACAEGRRLY